LNNTEQFDKSKASNGRRIDGLAWIMGINSPALLWLTIQGILG
jgi:hypothetical protein